MPNNGTLGKAKGRRTRKNRNYNRAHYTTRLFRYRTDSELAERLAAYADCGDTSVNLLITRALCDYFNVGIPHMRYETYERKTYWPMRDIAMETRLR